MIYQTAQPRLHSDTAGYVSDYIIKLADCMRGQLKRFGRCATTTGHVLALVTVFSRFGSVEKWQRSSLRPPWFSFFCIFKQTRLISAVQEAFWQILSPFERDRLAVFPFPVFVLS